VPHPHLAPPSPHSRRVFFLPFFLQIIPFGQALQPIRQPFFRLLRKLASGSRRLDFEWSLSDERENQQILTNSLEPFYWLRPKPGYQILAVTVQIRDATTGSHPKDLDEFSDITERLIPVIRDSVGVHHPVEYFIYTESPEGEVTFRWLFGVPMGDRKLVMELPGVLPIHLAPLM